MNIPWWIGTLLAAFWSSAITWLVSGVFAGLVVFGLALLTRCDSYLESIGRARE